MTDKDIARELSLNCIDGFVFRHYNPRFEYMLNDDELRAVWKIICSEIGSKKIFYDTHVDTFEQFQEMFSEDGNFLPIAFIFHNGLLAGVCWLSHAEAKIARLHFVTTVYSQKMRITVEVGRAMMKHWARMRDQNGEPLIESLIGITPKSYKLVLKYIQKVGFTLLGTVKGGIHFLHEGRYDDAIISTMEMKEEY